MFDNRIMMQLVNECENELRSIGYSIPKIDYVINTRAKKRLGQCKAKRNAYGVSYEINLSKNYMDEYFKINDINEIKNTIIHEILHTMPNCMNHGKEWQKHASFVNSKLKYDISRTCKVDKRVLNELVKKSKYNIICKECGQTYNYNRKTYFMDDLKKYCCTCHKCKSDNLELVQNY